MEVDMRDIIIIGSLALLLSGCVCTIAIVKPEPLQFTTRRSLPRKLRRYRGQ